MLNDTSRCVRVPRVIVARLPPGSDAPCGVLQPPQIAVRSNVIVTLDQQRRSLSLVRSLAGQEAIGEPVSDTWFCQVGVRGDFETSAGPAELDAGRRGHSWSGLGRLPKKKTAGEAGLVGDGRCRARTSDLLLVRQALSQLS